MVKIVYIIIFVFIFTLEDELQESIKRGEEVYNNTCIICHKHDGEGMLFSYPPLANSDFLMDDPDRAIRAIKFGLEGEITVNGATYYNEMPAQELSDQEIVDVMNYILNSWGNKGENITLDRVKSALNKNPSK